MKKPHTSWVIETTFPKPRDSEHWKVIGEWRIRDYPIFARGGSHTTKWAAGDRNMDGTILRRAIQWMRMLQAEDTNTPWTYGYRLVNQMTGECIPSEAL